MWPRLPPNFVCAPVHTPSPAGRWAWTGNVTDRPTGGPKNIAWLCTYKVKRATRVRHTQCFPFFAPWGLFTRELVLLRAHGNRRPPSVFSLSLCNWTDKRRAKKATRCLRNRGKQANEAVAASVESTVSHTYATDTRGHRDGRKLSELAFYGEVRRLDCSHWGSNRARLRLGRSKID